MFIFFSFFALLTTAEVSDKINTDYDCPEI